MLHSRTLLRNIFKQFGNSCNILAVHKCVLNSKFDMKNLAKMVDIEVKSWQFGEIEYKVSDLGEIESPGRKLPKYFWEHCYLA